MIFGFSDKVHIEVEWMLKSDPELPPKDQKITTINVEAECECTWKSELHPKNQENKTVDEKQMKSGICLCQKALLLFSNLEKTFEEKETQTVEELESKTTDEKQMKSGICFCQKSPIIIIFKSREDNRRERNSNSRGENDKQELWRSSPGEKQNEKI